MAIDAKVKKTEPMTVAFASMKGPYSLIGETFGQLYGWIEEKGFVPSGPPIGVYFNAPGQVPDTELLWELRSPIAGEVVQSGPDERGLGIKKVEGAEVASTMHRGPFDQVGETWGALMGWIMENGYQIMGPGEEIYLTDPDKTPSQELLTEICFPVKKQ